MPRHIAAGMVHAPFDKYAVFRYAYVPPDPLEIQHFEDVFGQVINAGDTATLRAYPPKLGVVQSVARHMAALGAVGKVDQHRDGKGPLCFLFHGQEPRKSGALRLIQLRQLLGQGVQIVQSAGIVQHSGQFLKLIILCDLPIRRLILRQPELVKGVLHLVGRGGEGQRRVGAAFRLVLFCQIDFQYLTQGSFLLPSGAVEADPADTSWGPPRGYPSRTYCRLPWLAPGPW